MSDKISKLLMVIFVVLTLVGCSGVTTKVSLTYTVATGDKIKIELDTTDGLKLKNAGESFEIVRGDEVVAESSFLIPEGTEAYIQAGIENDATEHNGGYLYQVDGVKFYVKKLTDKTGLIISYTDDAVIDALSVIVE